MSNTVSSTEWTDEEVENYLSHLSEDAFKNRTPIVVYLSAIMIVGFMGNSLVLLVYGFRFRPSAHRTFVLVMAVLDLIINIVTLPLLIATVRHTYNNSNWRCRVYGTSMLSTIASGAVLVLIALDRFRRVCAPLKKQVNSRQAFYLCLACVFLTVIIFAPFVPYYGVHQVNTTNPWVQVRMCWTADEYKDTFYPTAHKITGGVVYFTALAILVFSYIRIGIKLWRRRAAKKTRSLRLQQVQENQNDPGASASGTANNMGQDNLTGQQDQHACVGKGLVPTRSAAGHEEKFETAFCDSSSTENRLSNSTPFSPETTAKGPAQLDTEIVTHGNESKCDLPKHDQCQTESGGSSREGECPNGPPEENRSTTIEQNKPPARSPSAHQYLRRIRSRTTLMMAVLTLLFVINWLPHFFIRALHKAPINLCDNFTDCGYNTYAIIYCSVYLNSAINAFVYSFCNERFRHECRQFFQVVVRKLSCRT